MEKIRLGIVGLGHRGRFMYKLACENFENVVAAAACDIFPRNFYEKRWGLDKAMCELFPNTAFYESYDEMLEKADLDAVLVETGANIHASFCIKALERNIHVLTDIPVVASLAEADALWRAASRSSAKIAVGANPNMQKFVSMLKEFHETGRLGNPYYMEAEYIHWAYPNSEMSAILNENGDWRKRLVPVRYCTHSLGPLLSVLHEDIKTATCFQTGQHAAKEEYAPDGKKPDMTCAIFQTASGVTIRFLRNGRCRADCQGHTYRVFGTQGYMEREERPAKAVIRFNSELDFNKKLQEVGGEHLPPEYAGEKKIAPEVMHGGLDYILFDKFFKAITLGTPLPVTLKEGLAMTLPGIYAEKSLNNGSKTVKVYYPWDEEWAEELKKETLPQ